MRPPDPLRAGALLAALVAAAGCGARPPADRGTAAPAPGGTAGGEPLLLGGVLEAGEGQRLLAPITSTWVDLQLQWLVPDGGHVEPGDVVARFDPGAVLDGLSDLEATLEEKEREARLQEVRARRLRLELEAKLAEAEAAARKAALEAEVPPEIGGEWAHRKASLEAARRENDRRRAENELRVHDLVETARRGQLELELAELRRKIEDRRADLSALELRAERPGEVLIREHPWEDHKLRPGDRLWPGYEVAVIPDPSSLYVVAWAREEEVGGSPRVSAPCAFPTRFRDAPSAAA